MTTGTRPLLVLDTRSLTCTHVAPQQHSPLVAATLLLRHAIADVRLGTKAAAALDELEASALAAASRLHRSGIAVVHARPGAALAGRPRRARWS